MNHTIMNYFEKHLFSKLQLSEVPSKDLGIIVTIPCFNEPELIRTLQSLESCDATHCEVEVIIHINSSENSSTEIIEQNNKTINEFSLWNKNKTRKYFLLHSPTLPHKHAGVGLARKIAMDEAASRFSLTGNEKGIIVCIDADCIVEKNYLVELEKHFQENSGSIGCSINFAHPLEGNEFDKTIYSSIINYELFLRYYILSLKWSGFPYSFHTIGSSMAVMANAYTKQGGMNRRKAGEDFYFLHKLFPLGKFTTLNSTWVTPSPRVSNRVPFGTGADISKQLLRKTETYLSYNFQTFIDLKNFFILLPSIYSSTPIQDSIPPSMKEFLLRESFGETIEEIKSNTSNEETFLKRFFSWFHGFKVLKFVHFAREHFYPNQEITMAVSLLLQSMKQEKIVNGKKEILLQLRKIEKEN